MAKISPLVQNHAFCNQIQQNVERIENVASHFQNVTANVVFERDYPIYSE